MDRLRAIRILAARDVIRDPPDPLYAFRRIVYWYAERFGLAPSVVEDLPLEDVLRTYYEITFEEALNGDAEQRYAFWKMIADLAADDSELEERRRREALELHRRRMEDEALDREADELAEKSAKIAAEKKAAEKTAPRIASTPDTPDIAMTFDDLGPPL